MAFYIIRFEGTLTQGPNAGKIYTWANSWGGVQFKTEEEARAKLGLYREREPDLPMKILRCEWAPGDTRYRETEVV